MADHLEKRGDYWYAFLQVPVDLRFAVGSAKKRIALGTTNKQEAKLLAMQHVLEWKREFAHLRAVRKKSLTSEMIEADLKSHYQNTPEEAPYPNEDGTTSWIALQKDAELASYISDTYDPETLDRHLQLGLSEAYDVVTGKLVRMADYVDGWRANSDATAKTLDVAEKDIRDMIDHFKTVENVTRPAVQKYIRNQLGHLALATQKRKASAWRVFWDHLMIELEVDEPRKPFDGLFSKGKTKASRKKLNQSDRAAFSIEDVELLYHSTGSDRALKQLIKIGAYTGMRIEEICNKSRITDNGKWLTVEDAKTEAGNRRLPIHQTLIDDGTIDDWFNNIRPTLTPNKYGIYSDALGKRFGRLKTKLGFGKELVFHSLRHTAATQMKRRFPHYGVIINELLGHEKPKDQSFGLYAKQTEDYKLELINSLTFNFD